jgi:hypothetical protein
VAKFTYGTSGGDVEFLLPLRTDFRDYAERMFSLLDTLEKVESRSQLAILADLHRTSLDVVRVAVDGPSVHAGSVGLESGAGIIDATRDLVLAGACAAIEKRPLYARRKPQLAMDFLRETRLAAPESGSFVVVRLRFSWARGRPVSGMPAEEVFARGTADVLWEVSRKFRQEAPRPRFELEGYVVELQSKDPTTGGVAVLNAVIDDRLRRVFVPLPVEDYQRAIEGHRRNALVAIDGDLIRDGGSLWLHNAAGVAFREE